jgi:hypothetical protein
MLTTEPRAVATGSYIQFHLIALLTGVEYWTRSLPLAVRIGAGTAPINYAVF